MVIKCKECDEPLRYASEVQSGCLCGKCGPGSLKHQKSHGGYTGSLSRATQTRGPDVIIREANGQKKEFYRVRDANGIVSIIDAEEWAARNDIGSHESFGLDPEQTLDLTPKVKHEHSEDKGKLDIKHQGKVDESRESGNGTSDSNNAA